MKFFHGEFHKLQKPSVKPIGVNQPVQINSMWKSVKRKFLKNYQLKFFEMKYPSVVG